jgi:hypothetical protein
MIIYKQTGRTITAVIEGKPYILTCKTSEQLADVKTDLEKIEKTKSEKMQKTLTNKLLKQFKPKEEESQQAKDKKIAEIKGAKAKAKKDVKNSGSGKGKKKGAETKLAEVVTSVAVVAEEKLEKAVEVAKTIEVKTSSTGMRRSGEY